MRGVGQSDKVGACCLDLISEVEGALGTYLLGRPNTHITYYLEIHYVRTLQTRNEKPFLQWSGLLSPRSQV